MTIRLIFPDPLEWWSGLEWGVEAAALLIREGYDLSCRFMSAGPMLEAVAFAALDLDILNRCEFSEPIALLQRSDIVIMARVTSGPDLPLKNIGEPLGLIVTGLDGMPSPWATQQVARRDPAAIAAAVRRLFTPDLPKLPTA